jgi:hypothetical protein
MDVVLMVPDVFEPRSAGIVVVGVVAGLDGDRRLVSVAGRSRRGLTIASRSRVVIVSPTLMARPTGYLHCVRGALHAGVWRSRHNSADRPLQFQNVNSISEIREVFDTVVLWIIEGMALIDSNQHTRLRSCFDMRCQGAHPGDAPITQFNLLSFFSDLDQIVFSNAKFKV